MNNEILGILAAIVCMFSFGLVNVLTKKPAEHFGAMQATVLRQVVLLPILFIVLVLTWERHTFNIPYMVLAAIIASFSYFGLYFFTIALTQGKVGVVVPLSSGRVFVTTVIAIVFLNDSLNSAQFAAMLVLLMGISLISLNLAELKQLKTGAGESGISYALLAVLFWGVTFALFSIPIAKIGAYLFTFILELSVFTMATLQTVFMREKLPSLNAFQGKFTLMLVLMGITGAAGSLFLNIGYDLGSISIVTAISSASPIVSLLYATTVFKEKLSIQQYLAIALIMFGVITLPLL